MKKLIALASTLFATSVVSVGAAVANPASGTQPNSAPVNPIVQPSEVTPEQPVDTRDKTEVKSIDAPVPSVSPSTANQCVGDARFATPPVVNNPHHIRNVVWRNMRSLCAN